MRSSLAVTLFTVLLTVGCGQPTPQGVTFTSKVDDGPKDLITTFIRAAREGQAADIAALAQPADRTDQKSRADELVSKHRSSFQGDITVSVTEGDNAGTLTACLGLKKTKEWATAHINGTGSLDGTGWRNKWTLDWFQIRSTPCSRG
ncbi:hypothetical protein ACQEU3_44495 [Spirillospora sp. CA-253888]